MNFRKRLPREELERLYVDQQLTSTEIAKRCGASFTSVCKWLADYGIPRRSPSEAKRLDMTRWSPEERKRIAAASGANHKGRKQTDEHRCKIALTRQRTTKPSAHEAALIDALAVHGLHPIHEFALFRFNLDLAFPDARLAVEVDGGNWHRNSPRKMEQDAKKRTYLEGEGWKIVRVGTRRLDWIDHATIAVRDALSWAPAPASQAV